MPETIHKLSKSLVAQLENVLSLSNLNEKLSPELSDFTAADVDMDDLERIFG